jgi:alpha-soluble NSF attachment protein
MMDPLVLIALAKKHLQSSKSFFTLNSTDKIEQAAELYEKAGNLYKIEKSYDSAAAAYKEAARCYNLSKNYVCETTNYSIAAMLYRKATNHQEYLLCIERAIELTLNLGYFDRIGKLYGNLANFYEHSARLEEAILYYEKAAEYYEAEDKAIDRRRSLLSVAYISAQLERYERATELYEAEGVSCLSTITKWSAPEYFFKACICRLCEQDTVSASKAVAKYLRLYPAFEDTREYRLIIEIIRCLESDEVDSFTSALTEFDTVSRLDDWTTQMMLRIKMQFENIC